VDKGCVHKQKRVACVAAKTKRRDAERRRATHCKPKSKVVKKTMSEMTDADVAKQNKLSA